MKLFQNFRTVTNPAAVTVQLIAHAAKHGIDADEINRGTIAAYDGADWAPEACQALGIRGRHPNAIRNAFSPAMVTLCLTAASLVGCLIPRSPGHDFYDVEERVNGRILAMAS